MDFQFLSGHPVHQTLVSILHIFQTSIIYSNYSQVYVFYL